MTRALILFFSLAFIGAAGCERRLTAHEGNENAESVSKTVADAKQGDGAYCFYEVRDLANDRTSKASETRLALLRAMWKNYEGGDILLPPQSRKGLIAYADACNQPIIEPIVIEFGMTVSQSNFVRYKNEYVRAQAPGRKISLAEANQDVSLPLIDDRFEDRAYCFFEIAGAENDRTSDASDVREAILGAIIDKYESDEIFLQPLSVGRVIYYAEACNREIVAPIIRGYGLTVTQSSDVDYKNAYAAAVAQAGGFQIDQ